MRHVLGFFVLACSIALAQTAPSRPPLTGISHIAVYTTDAAAAQHYYVDIVGCEKRPDPENPQGTRYYIDSTQFVEVLPLPDKSSPDRLDHLAYKTTNAEGLRLYLKSKSVEVPASVHKASDGSRWFDVKDPEGNTVQFVQPPAHPQPVNAPNLLGHHIIHVGMLVHSREKEDTFYRAILDFKPYWYGGMQPGKIDWVSQQTPESHDWLEYMLTSGPPGGGIQEISQHQFGVLNHFSIGVVSVPKTFDALKAANRLAPPDAHTQIGRDGKWQLNLFDPDGTRLEYMEFSNVRPPCCSEFTAPNPSPSE
ncbi:MAG TPA: VOC family protein [Alloacidobacterium sp.]|nr:VOC family protein [Alloacidobacterium sp.]